MTYFNKIILFDKLRTDCRGAKARRSVRRQKMIVVWANMVTVEWEVPSGCVDGPDERCERTEVKDCAKILEE